MITENYRVVRKTNSWGLYGWSIERFYPNVKRWVDLGDWYWTKLGANRIRRGLQREYDEWFM